MGCITSGMVQTSPDNSKNKVEPVTLKTDKVSRGVARDQRQKNIARHHSEAFNKAKSLSDRVLAEKETLSTSSTVRSSWSRNTALTTHTESPIGDGQNGKVILNPLTNNNNGQCTTKSVHFDKENQLDSGHFSDIPGIADTRPKDQGVTIVTRRAATPSHLKQQADDDAIDSTDEEEKTGDDNECTQADEADITGAKQLSNEQNPHQVHSDMSSVPMATAEDISANKMSAADEAKHESVNRINGDALGEDISRTSTEVKVDSPTEQEEHISVIDAS